MTGRGGRWLRVAACVAILGALLWQVGTGPFAHGVRSVDAGTLALGAALAVPTTVACAWRWQVVSRGLGVPLGLRSAVRSCYRSTFLNVALPGGVLGDVHRGVLHGRAAGDTGRGVRAVVWERFSGQVVQAVVALVVLLLVASPFRGPVVAALPAGLGVLVAAAVALAVLDRSRPSGPLRAAVRDVRCALLPRRAWPWLVLSSLVAVGGHVATYLVAARAVGVTASASALLPLAVLVLVAAGLPVNVGGWGPREGVAAWAFGIAGLGLEQGVATSVAYGVIVVVASLPGAVVLVTAASARRPEAVPAGGGHGG
jgi:uncharacterized membrane protein YbhN (UPF0104 family)